MPVAEKSVLLFHVFAIKLEVKVIGNVIAALARELEEVDEKDIEIGLIVLENALRQVFAFEFLEEVIVFFISQAAFFFEHGDRFWIESEILAEIIRWHGDSREFHRNFRRQFQPEIFACRQKTVRPFKHIIFHVCNLQKYFTLSLPMAKARGF